MLSIINRGKRILKAKKEEDLLNDKDVQIGSDGLIDP